MSDLPLVSIVIPAFRGADYLRDCLSSIRQQDFPRWEAIIVDDASPGDPFTALRTEFPGPAFRWFRHAENRGCGASRNTGASHARGEFIFLVDSDDELKPECVGRLAGALQADRTLDCAFSYFEFFGDETKIHVFQYSGPGSLARSHCVPCQIMIRRSVWEELGGQSTNPPGLIGNEDWEFWIRLAKRGVKLLQIPEPLYRYRVRPSSVTPIRRCQEATHRRRFFRAHGEFIGRHVPEAEFIGEGHWIAAHGWNARRHAWRAFGHATSAWWLTHDHRRFGRTCKAIAAYLLQPPPTP